MANFAELDATNHVRRIIIVDDDKKENGETYLKGIFGEDTKWKETVWAFPGALYDEEKDEFVLPDPPGDEPV